MTFVTRIVFISSLAFCGIAYAAEPLDGFKSGKLECSTPDPEKHTCRAITSYTVEGSKIINTSDLMLSASPSIVVRMSTQVQFKGNLICGKISRADVDAGTVTVNGERLTGASDMKIKDRLWTGAYGPRSGKELCSSYQASDRGFIQTFLIDGKLDTMQSSIVKLIDAQDGYVLGFTPPSPVPDRQ